ncbi:MAG: Parallel beta-helix repeat, partial [Geobacteraceae bacterium]
GTIVKFASGAGLQIGNGTSQGALVARGTATDRIVFTRSAASGTWGTITLNDGTVDATTAIEYADIQYSSGVTINSASPVFRNTTITDLTGYVNLSTANPLFENVTIANNGSYGFYLSSASPTITGGSLTNSNTTGYGIYGSGSPVISNYSVSIVNSAGKYGIYLSTTTSTLSLTNSTIANGLYLGSTAITPTITGNTFSNSDNSPPHAGANIIAQLLVNNTFTGMTAAGKIEIVGEQVKQDALWRKLAAPYWVVSGNVAIYKDTVSPATLTIEAGAVLKFTTYASLQIGNGTSQGALIARGTSTDRITFTRSGTTGAWGAISFQDGTADATAVIENADIQYSAGVNITSASPVIRNSTITDVTGYGLNVSYANPTLENVTITNNGAYGVYLSSSSPVITGGSLTNSNSAGYGIWGSGSPVISNYAISVVNSAGKYGLYLSSFTSTLSITNSTIANGIYLGSTGFIPAITGNTFSNSDNSPPHAGAAIISQLLNGNTFTGLTSAGKLEVVGEQVTQNTVWKKWAAPYVVLSTIYVYKDAVTAASLTIEPGVVVKFVTGAGLQVGSGSSKGVLIADASSANPITFTSNQATPAPGNWTGIALSGDASSASILSNAIIEYGGAGGNYYNANLSLSSSSPIIRNCTIRNSAGSGIYMSSSTNIPQVLNSVIAANKWGVYAASSNPYIGNSQIFGNTTAGVWNATTTIDVDARNNWWGASSGPSHATNPSGTGNAVSDKVLFNPWIGQTPGSALTFSNVKIAPAAFNPEGDFLTFAATLSTSANWTVTVTDSGNTTVRTFTGTGTAINQKWFGEDNQSVKVVDGTYSYKIEAVDPTTSEASSPLQGIVKVMRQLPIAILDVPADDQIYSGGTVVNVTGTAADAVDFKNYTLDYGTGDNPASWTVLKNATTQVQNALIYAWDLTTATGGVYTLRLTVTDNGGNSTVKTARIRLLWIQNATISESYISPNGDGIKDMTVISATASYPVNWTVTFSNTTGTVVRTLTGTGSSSFSQAWDGRDSSGILVPDGTYTYRVNATDPVSSLAATPKTGALIVDNTAPAASVTAPTSGAGVQNTVTIVGTASDTNLDNYKVEYGPATGNGPWTLQATSSTPVTAGTLAVWITNDLKNVVLVQNGAYTLRLTVADKAGNVSVITLPLNVDNLILSNISASRNTLNTNASESSTISFAINGPAIVTLKIVPEKLGPTGAPVYQASFNCLAAGPYSFFWDGKDATGKVVPDEAYLYILEASDGTRIDSYNPPVPSGPGSVTCSQDTYNPYKNDPLTVSYTLPQPARINISISWGSQNFKIMDAIPHITGTYSVDWDGRNPSNKILESGAGASCTVASLIRENHIITTGDTPKVTLVKTDPYQMHLAYGQFTRIKYTIAKDAVVTVKLVSPSGAAFVLVNSLNQTAGTYEFEWTAADLTDTAGKLLLLSEEGDYMVSVQAVNPTTGSSSVTKGNLRIGF